MNFVEVSLRDLKTIDKIVELSHQNSSSGLVHNNKDWDFVKVLWRFFKASRPGHYRSFIKEQEFYRDQYKNNKYGVKEEGEGYLQHVSNLPEPFMFLLQKFFPQQRFDTQFYIKLRKEIADFNLGNVI